MNIYSKHRRNSRRISGLETFISKASHSVTRVNKRNSPRKHIPETIEGIAKGNSWRSLKVVLEEFQEI